MRARKVEVFTPSRKTNHLTLADLLIEIKALLADELDAEIVVRHMATIRIAAASILLYCSSYIGLLLQFDALPINLILTLSPSQIATFCAEFDTQVQQEQITNSVRLLQKHAAALGYRPARASDAWMELLLLHHTRLAISKPTCGKLSTSAAFAARLRRRLGNEPSTN